MLMLNGYRLNSGGAPGADTAFEKGCGDVCSIFIPWEGFERKHQVFKIPRAAYALAAHVHFYWDGMSFGVRSMMARNCLQVLGEDMISWVEFVLCWTQDGCESHETRKSKTGGTGQAIAVASLAGIPVINMANENWLERLISLGVFKQVDIHEEVKEKWLNSTRSKLPKLKKNSKPTWPRTATVSTAPSSALAETPI